MNNNDNDNNSKRKDCDNKQQQQQQQQQDENDKNENVIITTNKKLKIESPPSQQVLINDDKNNTEIVFWKVFRNIVLFKNIFSNFNKSKLYYGYNDLAIDSCCDLYIIVNQYHDSTQGFFKNHSNSIEIIIDNIKSNQNHQIIKNNKNLISIIRNIRKNNEKTRSFYNLLFKTYSTTPSSTSMIQFDQLVDLWIYYIVKSLNYVALFQFIKYFKINSNEIKKYLEIHFDSRFFEIITYRPFKIYNYLKSNGCIDHSNIVKSIKIDTRELYKYLSFDNKFKKLIKLYKLVIEFINQQDEQQQNEMIEFKKYGGDKFYKLVLELNEIQSNQFTNDQLNSTVIEILKNNKNSGGGGGGGLNEIIKKYIKSIYLFFNYGKEKKNLDALPFDYYIYFKNSDVILKKIRHCNIIYNYYKWLDLFEVIKDNGDKLEFVLNILEIIFMNTIPYSRFDLFIQAIFSSNDKELIEPVLVKILTIQQQQQQQSKQVYYKSFKRLVIQNLHLIKNKEILELLYNNDKFRNECGLFINDNNFNWLEDEYKFGYFNENIQTIELYEDLLSSVGLKYNYKYNTDFRNCFQVLNRVILKPSVYSYDFNDFEFDRYTYNSYNEYKEDILIEFLSNVKLKKSIDLDSFLSTPLNSTNNNSFYKFLFQNISKETISNKINEIKQTEYKKSILELTATIIDTPTSTSSANSIDSSSIEYNNIIIGKTKSFNFQISLKTLLLCLYHMGRIDDIIYILETTPYECDELEFLYNSCSIYYLELFINYFINYIKTIDKNYTHKHIDRHLYYCLSIASSKGFTQIFKNIISS